MRSRRLVRLRDALERVLLRVLTEGVPVFDREGRPVLVEGKQVMTTPPAAYASVARSYLHDVAPDIKSHQHGMFFEALKVVRDRNRDGFAAEPDQGEEEIE